MTFAKLELPTGHLGKRAPTEERAAVRRQAETEAVKFPPGATDFSYVPESGIQLLATDSGTEMNIVPMDVRRLDIREVAWGVPRAKGQAAEEVHAFYAWDSVDQVLLYDPRPNDPPQWLLDGLWGRHVAVDEGLLESVHAAPLEAPRATAPPLVSSNIMGEALDRMSGAYTVTREVGESDADLRGRVNREIAFEGATATGDLAINPDGTVRMFSGLNELLDGKRLRASFTGAASGGLDPSKK